MPSLSEKFFCPSLSTLGILPSSGLDLLPFLICRSIFWQQLSPQPDNLELGVIELSYDRLYLPSFKCQTQSIGQDSTMANVKMHKCEAKIRSFVCEKKEDQEKMRKIGSPAL